MTFFNVARSLSFIRKLRNKQLRRQRPWDKIPNTLKATENALHAATWLLCLLYIAYMDQLRINGMSIILPAIIAGGITFFCVSYEETPCNATMQLMFKVLGLLRLALGVSAALKIDSHTSWDWSTTFWPYWCSFAIQGIIAIASLIIFFNTVINFLKDEATKADSKFYPLIVLSFVFSVGIHGLRRLCHLNVDAYHFHNIFL